MDMKIKPLMLAVALALGASGTAFAQAGSGDGSGGNTNALVKQPSAVTPSDAQASPNMDNNANSNTNAATGKGFDNDTRINGQPALPKNQHGAKSTTKSTTGNAQLQTGRTGAGTNAFDTDTKINGTRALPRNRDKNADTVDHSSSVDTGTPMANSNAETQPTPSMDDQQGMNSTMGSTSKAKSAHNKSVGHTQAGKAKAQNSTSHRTDEPFRDDTGRMPGSNPESTDSGSSVAK